MRNNEKKRKLAMTMRVRRMESYQGYRNIRDACSWKEGSMPAFKEGIEEKGACWVWPLTKWWKFYGSNFGSLTHVHICVVLTLDIDFYISKCKMWLE
jgi:hypothetical protein